MDILFYIVVVSYNSGDKLISTIRNIKEQTYENYKIIIKDGASVDDSLNNILKEYNIDEKTYISSDGKVHAISEKDGGIYDAMNVALDYITCMEKEDKKSFVYFLNCGDYFADKEVLSKMAEKISKTNGEYDIYYGDIFERITNQHVTSTPVINDFALYRNVPCHQACFYDLKLMNKEHFDTTWIIRADYEHFLRSYYIDKAKCYYTAIEVADYEGGGFSESGTAAAVSERERSEIVKRYMKKNKVRLYDFYRIITLANLRTYLERNPKTSAFYNKVRSGIYKLLHRK